MTRQPTGFASLPAGRIARLVYGADPIPNDDPAENYHEASKISPGFAVRQAAGVGALEADLTMQERVRRAVRRHGHRRSISTQGGADLTMSVGEAIHGRRSNRDFGDGQLGFEEVVTTLSAGYGTAGNGALRTVPSGGALFPLELYLIVLAVDGLSPAIYHFNPIDEAVEEIRSLNARESLSKVLIHPQLVERASVFIAITALFWRTRFKYGLRGYRFCLIEAGHVMQNILLAATALKLAAVPVAGYFDRSLDRLLSVDGVTESAVYGVAIGRPK